MKHKLGVERPIFFNTLNMHCRRSQGDVRC